ncbi:hypothetical protein [Marinagarivorans algicola]|uniref:hypothetical protein n=1 Tax=Marinagarivorans algicola TaxID=1513270 RepID=UPI003735565D
MSRKRKIQLLFLFLIAMTYLAASHFLLDEIKPVHSNNLTKVDDGANLKNQCASLQLGLKIQDVENILATHNRKLIANTQGGKVGTYWITDGLKNLHLPKGQACIAYFNTQNKLKSSEEKIFK